MYITYLHIQEILFKFLYHIRTANIFDICYVQLLFLFMQLARQNLIPMIPMTKNVCINQRREQCFVWPKKVGSKHKYFNKRSQQFP